VDKKDLAFELIERFAYPERYVNVRDWHSGDGPFEEYCNKLQEEARRWVDEHE
jgi:hypothetical protein